MNSMLRVSLLVLLFCQNALSWYYGRPDPGLMTQGEVWPMPWTVTYNGNLTISPLTFTFISKVGTCEIIDKAIARYQKITFAGLDPKTYSDSGSPQITSLVINIYGGCDTGYPQLEMDEAYSISVSTSSQLATLNANQVWGALRGLETFSQLVFQPTFNKFYIRAADISDKARFPHRGVMLDSSRHFLPVGVLLQNLDIMAHNKLNVFHWHLTDSESIPYTSAIYPNLSQYGAYTPAHVYSIDDMKKVIEYARLRGIRVVPEFDTPGHTGAWDQAFPNLLSKCYNTNGQINQLPNIIDASLDSSYDILSNFFTEALALFKDNYMHFGGDEVIYDMQNCWYNNAQVRQRMQSMGFGSDTSKLLNYYWQKLFDIIDKARANTKKIVWQEVLDQNVPASGSIAHVWKGDTIDEVMSEMASVTAAGHNAILSSCWYLNYIKYGADWRAVDGSSMQSRGYYYQCDPQGFQGTQEQKNRVLGGEAALWGEFVDATNLISRLWPRASAVAERLWSDAAKTQSAEAAWPRLHEFRCKLLVRGYAAQPINDPDYCPFEWNPAYQEL